MTQKLEHETLAWTKHSAYTIENNMIVPAAGATAMQYHPWDGYRGTLRRTWQPRRRGRHRGEAQYMQLLSLGQALKNACDRMEQDPEGFSITEEEATAILAFVRVNGLIGLFHASVKRIGGCGTVWLNQGAGWKVHSSMGNLIDTTVAEALPYVGARVPEVVDYENVAARFFRASMPTPLPDPFSVEFAANYCEPVKDVVMAAVTFWDAFSASRGGDFTSIDALRAGTFIRTRAVRDTKGRMIAVDDEVIYPSLIHAFAEMVVRDAKGGFRILTCPGCGEMMRTNYPRTLYCSEPCRWKMLRREQRRKEAAARKTPVKRGRPRKVAGKKKEA